MNKEQLRVNARVEDEHWWFVGRRRIMREIVDLLVPARPDATLIDIGCGTGGNIGSLADRYRTIGIDTSPDAIELARGRFPRTYFILGRAPRDLRDDAARAGMFFLMDVLEHVRDDFRLLSALLAEASPGAYFLLTVPAGRSLWSKHDESHLHYRRYEPDRFRQLWSGLPVTTLAMSYFNSRLYRPIQAVRAANRLRGRASGEADTDLWVPNRLINGMLTAILAGEARRLANLVAGKRQSGYSHGVSLLAVLRREPGRIEARDKPAQIEPDQFDPEPAGLSEPALQVV